MAISSSFPNLHEFMDKIWFHKNILFVQPSNSSIFSMLHKDENILKSTSSSEDSSFFELLQPDLNKSKKKHIVQNLENHERHNIPTNKNSSENKIPQPTVMRMPEIRRSHWRLSELENHELKWFNDYGILLREKKFSERHNRFEESKVEEERKTYPSEACFINKAESPLLNLSMLPKTIEGTNMKRYLRFWAQRVASLVCEELYL